MTGFYLHSGDYINILMLAGIALLLTTIYYVSKWINENIIYVYNGQGNPFRIKTAKTFAIPKPDGINEDIIRQENFEIGEPLKTFEFKFIDKYNNIVNSTATPKLLIDCDMSHESEYYILQQYQLDFEAGKYTAQERTWHWVKIIKEDV